MKVKIFILIFIIVSVLCLCFTSVNDVQKAHDVKICSEDAVLKSTEIDNESLKIMVTGFLTNLRMSSKQYKFEDFPTETIVEMKKILIDDVAYYLCKYSNNKDLVFFLFYGEDLLPYYVIDVKQSFNDIIEFYDICSYDTEEYKYFYEIIQQVDNIGNTRDGTLSSVEE